MRVAVWYGWLQIIWSEVTIVQWAGLQLIPPRTDRLGLIKDQIHYTLWAFSKWQKSRKLELLGVNPGPLTDHASGRMCNPCLIVQYHRPVQYQGGHPPVLHLNITITSHDQQTPDRTAAPRSPAQSTPSTSLCPTYLEQCGSTPQSDLSLVR